MNILTFRDDHFDVVEVANLDENQFDHSCSTLSVFSSCEHVDWFDHTSKVNNRVKCFYLVNESSDFVVVDDKKTFFDVHNFFLVHVDCFDFNDVNEHVFMFFNVFDSTV